MKSLRKLAAIYDRWAVANETFAEEILSCVDSLPEDDQQQQRWRASHVMAEAAFLRNRAAELRDLDSAMVEIVQDGYKVPQDRGERCETGLPRRRTAKKKHLFSASIKKQRKRTRTPLPNSLKKSK